MINPLTMMKLNQTKNKFVSNHPKFAAFIKNFFSKKIEAMKLLLRLLLKDRMKNLLLPI